MKGTVGFASETGQGSTFWVEVPLAPAAEAAAPAGMRATGEPQLAPRGATREVVYVEDNPSNIAFMREVMLDLPGLALVTAPTAEIGLELIRAHRPALVIMDINLPGMSGFDAVRQLSEWPETRDIPVIALSAAALARDRTRAMEAGFDRYLTKPLRIDELMELLDTLLPAV